LGDTVQQNPKAINLEIKRLGDACEVHACAHLMANSEPWITLKRDYEDSFQILSDPVREVYVARYGGEIAGFAILQTQGAFVGYLQSVFVVPELRGLGIGTHLIQFAEDRILGEFPNVFICVSSFNPKAQKLYARLGYQVVGQLTDWIVRGNSEILMRKSIAPISEFQPTLVTTGKGLTAKPSHHGDTESTEILK
jgi:ribosomal-protein-alanine N-acetyltransferase